MREFVECTNAIKTLVCRPSTYWRRRLILLSRSIGVDLCMYSDHEGQIMSGLRSWFTNGQSSPMHTAFLVILSRSVRLILSHFGVAADPMYLQKAAKKKPYKKWHKRKGRLLYVLMAIVASILLVIIFALVNVGCGNPKFWSEVAKGCLIVIPIT